MSAPSTTGQYEQMLKRLSLWRWLGFQSKPVELVLYFLAVSGLMMWSGFGIEWPIFRSALFVHALVAILFFPLFVVPFWLSHRELLAKKRKPLQTITGRVLEFVIAAIFLTGLWLVFFGNPGNAAGGVAHWVHLLLAVPFTALLVVHAWRFSALRRAFWLVLLALAVILLVSPAFAAADEQVPVAVRSTSLAATADGKRLFSANFEAGSLSVIERESGKLLMEKALGRDIERVALAEADGLVAATDSLGGKLHILKLNDLSGVADVETGGRPWGVVFDARNHLFWVTLFEGARLLGIDESGKIAVDMAVTETPRGLALLADGRLLITHAMVGKVSIYDTKSLPLKLLTTITLEEEEDPDQTVSQGKPRQLDNIAISPDGTEAWLPHLLWNFDHPFQFQSTVFPAVSLLSLKPGDEHEVASRRKQLFQQINILEDGVRTRIVSNPYDARFSADGHKVFVTLAGSEDLVVFDRSRSKPIAKEERRDRRNGKEELGAKAVQIYRHLPGDNPRGLQVLGDDIYVQNAMSLDMSHLTTGGRGSFAKVSPVKDDFARLTEKDALSGDERQGLRLFNSANTDDFPDRPMAGDFWMSCGSCHTDGFNFTNGYLFRDTPTDKFGNAVIGHDPMKSMVGGDFIADYLRMVRDTQGGMGGDTRFGTPVTDPDKPDDAARQMMEKLHLYVTAQQNLPYLSTWLRLDGEDKYVHKGDWVSSGACASCHTDIFKQWADSNHRLMGASNPYYMVAENLAAKLEGEGFRQWCMGCHMPDSVMSGIKSSAGPNDMFEKGGKKLLADIGHPQVEEGTGCLSCHRITRLEDAGIAGGANASYTVNLKDRPKYLFEHDANPVLRWLGNRQIEAAPDTHAKSYQQGFYSSSAFCGSCHGEFAPGTGSLVVETYNEWQQSPFNTPDNPATNRTCQDCHMHADAAQIGTDIPGQSTDGGPVKANVFTHQFTGANYHLVGLRNPDLKAQSLALLRTAAKLSLSRTADSFTVRVDNVGAGHRLPTGVADFRQMWLEVSVTDATGREVLSSGKLAADGTVPVDARLFHKVFGRHDGTQLGFDFWRYEKMLEDTRIPPGGHRDERYTLPADTVFPVQAKVRLMFRIYPQHMTDVVRQTYPDLPNPEAVEMASATATLE
ncbi:hypothetical protein [Radicibacter daui]|uniref:hypothetical protein n=1 Tax=Radicibacter daui TaxID=3064829 RepID=UPI004046DDE8